MTTMTAQRQYRKTRLFALIVGLVFGLSIPLCADPISLDPQSGLAISGFDPVAYFADSSAQEGSAELELTKDGITWRFRNEGNRAAFAGHPEIYSPRFGGYDPVAIARGASVPGHPHFWLVSGQRLYLFYDARARAVFAAEPDRVVEAAERKWPSVQRTLP